MKNRVAYIQYMPNKCHSRFGIKKFELCDALSGYVLHVELYAGKDFPLPCEMGQAHGVVMDLMQKANLLNKGYHLFTDNIYTKPVLDQVLCPPRNIADRHCPCQLERHPCDTKYLSNMRVFRLPPRRHAVRCIP